MTLRKTRLPIWPAYLRSTSSCRSPRITTARAPARIEPAERWLLASAAIEGLDCESRFKNFLMARPWQAIAQIQVLIAPHLRTFSSALSFASEQE
jgi:hypothetical protein